MKKTTLLLALILAGSLAFAQKTVAFKIRFLPKHVYKLSYQTSMDMHMKMPDSLARQAGMQDGMTMKNTIFQGLHMTTGAKETDGSFPYEIKYDTVSTKMVMNGVEKDLPIHLTRGAVMDGKCTPEGRMHIDTILNGNTSQATQSMVKDMVNKLVDEVKFPDKPLAVGESFTQELPLTLPVLSADSKIAVKSTYKLTAIQGNLAYFDVNMDMNMDIEKNVVNNAMHIKGTGLGTGKLVYAIDKNFAIENNSNLDLRMDMLISNMNMQIDMKAAFNGKTEIN